MKEWPVYEHTEETIQDVLYRDACCVLQEIPASFRTRTDNNSQRRFLEWVALTKNKDFGSSTTVIAQIYFEEIRTVVACYIMPVSLSRFSVEYANPNYFEALKTRLLEINDFWNLHRDRNRIFESF